MIRSVTLLLIVGLAAGGQQSVQAQKDPAPSLKEALAKFRTATTEYLRFLEDREAMKSKLRDKRVASDDDVDFYRFQVAIARYSLTHLQNKPAEAREQFHVAVSVRASQHDRLKRLRQRGGGFDAEMDVAERQLASARYRLAHEDGKADEEAQHLKRIQEIAEQELERERRLLVRNAATPTEVEDASYRLIKARYLQARLKGRKDESLELLRDMASLTESALARLRKLELRGASSAEEIEWAQLRDHLVQQRLALVEEKTEKSREMQEKLASLTAQMLRRALRSSHGTEEETEYLKWQDALQRLRLLQAKEGVLADYENIWELDGWTHIPYQARGG